jgi:hypothetical protein
MNVTRGIVRLARHIQSTIGGDPWADPSQVPICCLTLADQQQLIDYVLSIPRHLSRDIPRLVLNGMVRAAFFTTGNGGRGDE